MTSLAVHCDFADTLLAPRRAAPAGLKATSVQEAEHRFAVHRNNVVASLVDALSDAFPVCKALVGDEFFRWMARERVLADPPRSPVLSEYVEGFADFIAGFAPADSVPYLEDVARIETLHVRAWHAADAQPVSEAAYRELVAAPQRLATTRVRLHPASGWLQCRHGAHAIWSAHQGLQDPSDASLEAVDTPRAQDVLVARAQLQVEVVALPPGATRFLDALADGKAIGGAIDAAHGVHPDAEIGTLFAILVRHGLVIAFDATLDTMGKH